MILSGFQEEQQLLEWYEEDTITALQYIEHHSLGMIDRFKLWCQQEGKSEDEETARDFLDEYNGLFLDTLTVTKKQDETSDILDFSDWQANKPLLNELFESQEAICITLWRYKNPLSLDKDTCASEVGVSQDDIHKWWMVVDFLNYAHHGSYSPIRLDEDAVGEAIWDVCAIFCS